MLDYLPAAATFLDPDRPGVDRPETARVCVIPFGLEASVSYGTGTASGPAAILAASHQLELYDEEFGAEIVTEYGIAAVREPHVDRPLAAALDQIADLVGTVVAVGQLPFVIGGEHSITPGAIRPIVARHPDLAILQIDAHADLRDGYLGEPASHAAAMRRCLDNPGVTVVSVGIRALCRAEADYAAANRDRIHLHWGRDQARYDIEAIVAPLAGRPLYVTFDVDGLDSALMPATGTPVPGGLGYLQALAIVRRACEVAGRVVGADLVELAPLASLPAPTFTAAHLAYKMMTYAALGPRLAGR
jgi:agmatinase